MRMNSDQEERAKKLVAVLSGWVAPALPGALCAALCLTGKRMVPGRLESVRLNYLIMNNRGI
jgi:hypothetical protein